MDPNHVSFNMSDSANIWNIMRPHHSRQTLYCIGTGKADKDEEMFSRYAMRVWISSRRL